MAHALKSSSGAVHAHQLRSHILKLVYRGMRWQCWCSEVIGEAQAGREGRSTQGIAEAGHSFRGGQQMNLGPSGAAKLAVWAGRGRPNQREQEGEGGAKERMGESRAAA